MEYKSAIFQVVVIRGRLCKGAVDTLVPDMDGTKFLAEKGLAVNPATGEIVGDKPLTVFFGSGLPVHGRRVEMEGRKNALVVPDENKEFFEGERVERYGVRVIMTRQ